MFELIRHSERREESTATSMISSRRDISWSQGDLAVVRSSTAAGALRLQQTECRQLSFWVRNIQARIRWILRGAQNDGGRTLVVFDKQNDFRGNGVPLDWGDTP